MEDDHAWRWSREGVLHRILAMKPADALLTVEQYNGRHVRDADRHIDPDACLRGLTDDAAADVMRRVEDLRQGATAWGQKYWAKRLKDAQDGIAASGDDSEITAEMAARHPGFSTESLIEAYHTGIMVAR